MTATAPHSRQDRQLFTDLAALMARGFLRLTQKGQIARFSGPGEPRKELDVPVEESPHGEDHGRAEWTPA